MINKNWKSHWKLVAQEKKITSDYMVQYCLLKALTAKSQNKVEIAQSLLRAAFTPVTNATELANGRRPYDTLEHRLTFRMCRDRKFATIFGFDNSIIMDEEGFKDYVELLDAIPKRNLASEEPEYLYLFVRQDISKEQQAVQASHAAFKAGYEMLGKVNPNEVHFVLVGVEDEQSLVSATETLTEHNHDYHEFYEPDFDNALTAIASVPMKAHKKRFLKKYTTLKFD